MCAIVYHNTKMIIHTRGCVTVREVCTHVGFSPGLNTGGYTAACLIVLQLMSIVSTVWTVRDAQIVVRHTPGLLQPLPSVARIG